MFGAGPVAAAKGCAREVIDDWYSDGRVDKLYDLHCYEDAIDALPEDVIAYSSAKEDIERALQDALGKDQPVDSTDPDPGDDQTGGAVPPSSGGGDEPTDGGEPRDGTPGESEALPDETSDASSVPLPLIVLGALALLLLAAGGAGYINRRLQARRVDGAAVEPPGDA